MNDAVHIKVKVVVFLVVRVFHTCVDRDLNATDNHRFFLHGVHDHPRIFLSEKSVEGWDSHLPIARYSKNETLLRILAGVRILVLSMIGYESSRYIYEFEVGTSRAGLV